MTPLDALLRDAGIPAPRYATGVEVADVTHDSRSAGVGSLFVAVPGDHTDGHDHAVDAVRRGAVAVVAQHRPPGFDAPVPVIIVHNTRAALAPLAAALHAHPSQHMTVAGITGTDGKTTTTTMLHAAWGAAGLHAGAMTTVDFRSGDAVEPNTTRQTTLEATDVQRRLRAMCDAGCTHVAMETSSHALALHRVDAVDFRLAVYTRITSEHLDFHGTRERYLHTKALLLRRVAERAGGVAVLDADDDFAMPLLHSIPVTRRLTYSAHGGDADLRATGVHADAQGVSFSASTPWGDVVISLRLPGRFNVANALAALAAACASGASLDGAVAGLESLQRVGGRMERVELPGQDIAVVIDYAHTAEALRTVLTELRAATRGGLWAVFGSAGERDVEKRPRMGAVAAALADRIVLCDEDPREEDRDAILEDIAAGARAAGAGDERLSLIADRSRAIDFAIAQASPGDTVLLAGKGHESCIISGRTALPWNERATAEAAVQRRLAGQRTPG